MRDKINSLSVILPAFNEEAVIEQTIKEVYAHVSRLTNSFEVIVVNDGSSDATADRVKKSQKKLPNLILVEHGVNKGYGETLRSGFNTASYDWIFQMDSDGQFRIEEIDKFLHEITNYDMVAGYRENRSDPWYREWLTWGYMSLLNILFDLPVQDVGCAFKLFKKQTWKDVQPIKSCDHKIFLVEWMWKLQKLNVKIKELPVSHYDRIGGQSTGANLDVMWSTIKQLARLKLGKNGFFLKLTRVTKKITNSEYGTVLIAIIGIKIVIFIISMVAFALFSPVPDSEQLRTFLPNIWNRWDTYYWYLNIAEYGYVSEGWDATRIVFLPLYPLLIRLSNILVNNYLWSAMLVANTLTVAGLFVFYLLAKLEFNKKVAWRALIALMLFPSAYFLNAAYTEGPFLLFAVGSFYLARRGNWQWAGVMGGLASLTRITGIILWPALLVEFYLQWRYNKKLLPQLFWTLIVPGGLLIYLLFNKQLFGSPFAFMELVNGFWHKQFAGPWVGLLGKWHAIGNFPYDGGTIVNNIAEFLAGIVLLIATVGALFRLRFSYTVYLAGVAFLYLSTSILQSTPRYLLTAFPLFFLMGILGKNKLLKVIWLPFSVSIMVLFMAHFVLGWGAF